MDEARAHILRLVEEGTMTPEQALGFLDNIDRMAATMPPRPGRPPRPHRPMPPPPPPPPPIPPGPDLWRDLGPQRARRVAQAVARGGQVVVSVASGAGPAHTSSQHGQCRLDGVREVVIEHTFGELVVNGGDSEQLVWNLDCTFQGEEPASASVDADTQGERLVLKVRVPQMTEGGLKATMRLQLPRSMAVRCECANGTVRVNGLVARARIRNANGDVSLGNHDGPYEVTALNGTVRLQDAQGEGEARITNGGCIGQRMQGKQTIVVSNGDVEVADSQGRIRVDVERGHIRLRRMDAEVRAECATGNIWLEEITGPTVSARTSSNGNIEAYLRTRPDGKVDLRAQTGRILLNLPADSKARLHLQTGSGRLHCDLPLQEMERSPHSVSGTLGDPAECQVNLATVLGDVEVKEWKNE